MALNLKRGTGGRRRAPDPDDIFIRCSRCKFDLRVIPGAAKPYVMRGDWPQRPMCYDCIEIERIMLEDETRGA